MAEPEQPQIRNGDDQMNNTIMVEYINRALDAKIEKVQQFINWQEAIIKAEERSLETKQGSRIGMIEIAYDEKSSSKELKEATEKRDKHLVHLERYKQTKLDFAKLIETWGSIQSDFTDVEEGSDATVLDEAVNDCLEVMGQFEKELAVKS
jgi:septum formation inhibitor MinC